jgi:hypothetical protein
LGEIVSPAEIYLSSTPALRAHAGTQPDLYLGWNAIPSAAAAVDVVVHLHGFSQEREAMTLGEKVGRGGVDLTRRARPTLAVVPRGNWIRFSWYDFPALLSGGIDRLIDYALQQFAAAVGIAPPALDRFILTAHSGGGMPALDVIAGARNQPDELHVFDGLYGRDPSLGDPLGGLDTVDRWLGERIAGEPGRPGALRVVYIERQTGPFSRAVGGLIARRLGALDPDLATALARRYRVEPSGVVHGRIAAWCGPDLLADPGCDLDFSR